MQIRIKLNLLMLLLSLMTNILVLTKVHNAKETKRKLVAVKTKKVVMNKREKRED